MVELVIPPGLSRGATPADRPGRWHSSNLIRWYDGVLQPLGGWQRLTGTPLSACMRRILAWRSNADVKYVAAALDDGLQILDGDQWRDVTPSAFTGSGGGILLDGYGVGFYGAEDYGDARETGTALGRRGHSHSLDTWGEDLFSLHSSDGRLLRWSPMTPNADAAPIAAAPTGNRCMVVTPERHVMLLGTGGQPRRIAWSKREDYNDWDYTSDLIGAAGFFDLDTEAMIVGAAEVREGTLAITEHDVWLVGFLGGDFVYGRQRLGSTTTISPVCVATFGGRAAWMTRGGQFVRYEAGQVAPLACEIAAWVADEIDLDKSPARAFAGEMASHGEVWFWFVSKTSPDGECDRCAVWSYLTNTWTMHSTLSRTCMISAGAHPFALMAGNDKHLWEHENGNLDGSLSRVGRIWAETNTMAPGGQVRVQRMQLDGGVPNATEVRIAARDTRDGTDLAYGPFTPNADGRTPVRAGGQDLRIRVLATTDDPKWSIGRFLADVVTIGAR